MTSEADMKKHIKELQEYLKAERFKTAIYEKQIMEYRAVLESVKAEVEGAL